MKYMIHTYPGRLWYVNNFLVPSMLDQGIPEKEILIWNDFLKKGNLQSCLDSFASCGGMPGGTWHLQDDVLISKEFAEETREQSGDRVVCGFCTSCYEDGTPIYGEVFPPLMWNSTFPCVYIPNNIAVEFVSWFYLKAKPDPEYADWIKTGKMDDTFFHEFMVKEHSNDIVLNHAPHLVEHVDYIVGGSAINQWRGHPTRGYYFDEYELTQQLTQQVVKFKNRTRSDLVKSVGGSNET